MVLRERVHQGVGLVVGVVAAAVWSSSCGGRTFADECHPGGEACPCAVGAQCEPGLTCDAGTCARLLDATGGALSTGGETPPIAAGGAGGAQSPVPPEITSCADDDESCYGESCCRTLWVPGGVYGEAMDPVALPRIHSYFLDKYEVTVGRFRHFVAAYDGPPSAGAGAHPTVAGTAWQSYWDALLPASSAEMAASLVCDPEFSTWTEVPGDHETLPLNCVNWYEAFAFCIWDGGRLPTEQENVYASIGGDEGRVVPWADGGDAWNGTHAAKSCMGDGIAACSFADIRPVGSFPLGNGRWGHADLLGNMWEIVFDYYDEEWWWDQICRDCVNLNPAPRRTMRGGGWEYEATDDRLDDFGKHMTVGFRCARDPL